MKSGNLCFTTLVFFSSLRCVSRIQQNIRIEVLTLNVYKYIKGDPCAMTTCWHSSRRLRGTVMPWILFCLQPKKNNSTVKPVLVATSILRPPFIVVTCIASLYMETCVEEHVNKGYLSIMVISYWLYLGGNMCRSI